MSTAKALIAGMGESAVWRSRVLGVRNAVTGHPAVTWFSGMCFDCTCFDLDCFLCDYVIEVIKKHISTREVEIGGTRMTQKVIQFYTWAPINKYDEVDYHGEVFVVESVQTIYYLNGLRAYQDCIMIQRSMAGDVT